VIAAHGRVGAILGDIPVTERYYSGGTTGQRGFLGSPAVASRAGGCTPGHDQPAW